MDTLWIVDNGGEIEKTIFNCSGICQSLTASRRNADMEFITARFYFKFVAYSRKLSGTIQLDNYHRRIRASSSYCEEESLSSPLSPFSTSILHLSLSFLFPMIFNHRHYYRFPRQIARIYALSVERKWRRRSKVSQARRFTPSRITYHGNVSRSNKSASPVQFIPLSVCAVAFFRALPLFFSTSSCSTVLLVLLTDRCHACILMHITLRFSGPRAEQSERDEGDIPRIWYDGWRDSSWSDGKKNVIVSLRACMRRGIISTINCTFTIKPADNGGASDRGRTKDTFRLGVSPNLLPLYVKYKISQKIWSKLINVSRDDNIISVKLLISFWELIQLTSTLYISKKVL